MNTLADFPPDRFSTTGYRACGHQARLPLDHLLADLRVDVLRARSPCAACGGREVSIRIGWIAAGAFK
ncbi:MAG TPA: hypothetical protein PKZ35_08880 [Gammaproteobacteria bacterium]|nr:hypothetical protein [Gammaproteobacteria bacterium]